ncbi:MAG TPA: hypothetical protein VIJ67_03625 [Pseudolabrys sp.]
MVGRIMPKANLARGERLQIMLSPEELSAVDDYRFRQRMPSRAAAVRELFRIGLASAGMTQVVSGKKSADFGVLDLPGGETGVPMPFPLSRPNE